MCFTVYLLLQLVVLWNVEYVTHETGFNWRSTLQHYDYFNAHIHQSGHDALDNKDDEGAMSSLRIPLKQNLMLVNSNFA
jgi:hypothetical protein